MATEVDLRGWQPDGARPAGADTLAYEVAGPARAPGATAAPGPGMVLAHGFAQTGRCWGPFGAALVESHRVLSIDQPGHGDSGRHADADLRRSAELLAATTGHAGPDPVVLVGYSMGARIALQATLAHPDRIAALVLIGGTAGIADPAERAARRASDAALAGRIERIGVDAFLAEWLALPMFAGLARWARFDAERRHNTAAGLAASLRRVGTGSMEPLWDRLADGSCPLLCLTGSLDERYGALAERIVAGWGGTARHQVVHAAGHAAHLERPDDAARTVLGFLAERFPERRP